MNSITTSAPGKIHLLGEHAAVYGKPVLLAALDRRCFVTITPREDIMVEVISKNLSEKVTLSEDLILNKTKKAQEQWKRFQQTNEISRLIAITQKPLDYAIIVIGETLLHYNKPLSSGFTLYIDSEIPIGSGMGSSASLAVAMVKAIACFIKQNASNDTVNTIAIRCEQKKHGFPSGGDTSTCCFGGLVWYRKETENVKIIYPLPFTLSQEVTKHCFIIFTGTPDESTGEMVSSVRTLYQSREKYVLSILDEQEVLTRQLVTLLQQEKHNEIIACLRKGERNLERLGVVSLFAKRLIRDVEESGGAAKICGGGGKSRATGILLAYHANRNALQNVIKSHHVSFLPSKIGTNGLQVEVT